MAAGRSTVRTARRENAVRAGASVRIDRSHRDLRHTARPRAAWQLSGPVLCCLGMLGSFASRFRILMLLLAFALGLAARLRQLPPRRHRCKARCRRALAPAPCAPAATAIHSTAGWLRVACVPPVGPSQVCPRKVPRWSRAHRPSSRHPLMQMSRALRRPPIPIRRGFFSTRDDDRVRLNFGASEIIEG